MAHDGNQLKKISDEYGSQNKYNVKEYNDLANLGTEFLYGNSCGGALLEFLAENTGVEWELSQTNDRANPDRGIDYIGTSHLKDKTKVGYFMIIFLILYLNYILKYCYIHMLKV